MKKHVEIYTDGACRGNPGPGGWGALLRFENAEKTLQGSEAHTTNNRMELLAAIKALAALKESCIVTLVTDSQYLRQGITTWLPNWKRRQWRTSDNKPVKNADLWQQLEQVAQAHEIQWCWVKGHNGHPENSQADALANQAIDQMLKQ